jgi:DNA modification methylase/predicted RNA-binding Zn-ribbon protein involved in translation (DUF1610 family)
MPNQPRLIAEPSADYDTEAAAARRERYLERLREYLQDPDFRAIEGFPIGEDEDILALSDPPYYTACPNPFLPEIIEQWQAERTKLRVELGLPDDSDDNGDGAPVYHREPFAADVSEGKYSSIYRAHTYHTKVPHKAIMRYILHYTDPGDIVFDGFCGTGMTGVAAQLCGSRKMIRELGYHVSEDNQIYDGEEQIAGFGARKSIVVDLSPAATFIASIYNMPVSANSFKRTSQKVLKQVRAENSWMYKTWHPDCNNPKKIEGRVRYVIWSDVFICPQCGAEIVLWDVAVDKEEGRVLRRFPCPQCGTEQSKRDLERAWETTYDPLFGQPVREAKQIPVVMKYRVNDNWHKKKPDSEDLALIQRIQESQVPHWFPVNHLPEGEKTGGPINRGITHVHQFFTRRNLWTTSAIWEKFNELSDTNLRRAGFFSLTAAMRYLTSMSKLGTTYYFHGGGGAINAGVMGTLYIPSFSAENNVFRTMEVRLPKLYRVFRDLPSERAAVSTQSASDLTQFPDECFDYIFIDPPFGGNLMYSELNFLWESWLQVLTDSVAEAIVNDVQCKRLPEYQRLMETCFINFHRILKPGRWMTVEFHNSKNRVWNAIQEGLLRAGFVAADVRTFDKQQGTFNQVTASGSVKQDLIISAYKPRTGFEQRFAREAGTPEGAWAFVRQHLAQLPVVVRTDGQLETLSERQDYLLFDRMVAFHIQRGATVPLSAPEFYAGLRQRFVERDGMFFLPEQVAEYDRARLEAESVAQLSLFVDDEKTAVQWLRQQLDPQVGGHPQTYQALQPQFLQQLHQARHEDLPELSEMLEQNFLQDDADRWYVPDPSKASDLEKLRRKALLREFKTYLEGKGQLRKVRTEAVRAGFADAWQRKDYATIVQVAERLDASVLQEDPELLMYYDNASLRVE